jgi:hypothetical protein
MLDAALRKMTDEENLKMKHHPADPEPLAQAKLLQKKQATMLVPKQSKIAMDERFLDSTEPARGPPHRLEAKNFFKNMSKSSKKSLEIIDRRAEFRSRETPLLYNEQDIQANQLDQLEASLKGMLTSQGSPRKGRKREDRPQGRTTLNSVALLRRTSEGRKPSYLQLSSQSIMTKPGMPLANMNTNLFQAFFSKASLKKNPGLPPLASANVQQKQVKANSKNLRGSLPDTAKLAMESTLRNLQDTFRTEIKLQDFVQPQSLQEINKFETVPNYVRGSFDEGYVGIDNLNPSSKVERIGPAVSRQSKQKMESESGRGDYTYDSHGKWDGIEI